MDEIDASYREWVSNGRPFDDMGVPPGVKLWVIRDYARHFGLRAFVETGSYKGDSISALLPYFDDLYSVELGQHLYEFCAWRFADAPTVHLHLGDSPGFLREMLRSLERPARSSSPPPARACNHALDLGPVGFAYSATPMALIVGFLAVGLVVAIAAVLVIREAGRIAKQPPPALFDVEESYEWVVAHLPDDVAATLTPDDVHRILEFQLEYFERKGVAGNGAEGKSPGPVVIGGAEAVAYILERAADTGEAYLPEQVYGVIDTQLSFLRSIGAIGPQADEPPPA